jgi:Arc/MetJ family transcription regulator
MMRTNIVIDDVLMSNALKASGLKTKKDARGRAEAIGAKKCAA